MKKIFLIFVFVSLFFAGVASAHQPNLLFMQKGDVTITDPEISRAFYDELKDKPKSFYIDSKSDFIFYINLLVPAFENPKGRYSAKVFAVDEKNNEKEILFLDGNRSEWQEYFEEFGRDYYYTGPEYEDYLMAGKYRIEVFSEDNKGKYVLAVGNKESFDLMSILNVYWQIPLLKLSFFKTSLLQFFLTPFGIGLIAFIGLIVIFVFFINYLISVFAEWRKHNNAKTLLLTSGGMDMRNEITKLLQKPAYDVNVAFITTAAKAVDDVDFVKKDFNTMRDMGFNIEEFDIEGKTEQQLFEILKLKDIIYVEGGNTFYLMKAMQACHFEKVLRKLLKEGIVYIGASAGSVVAGRTIQTANKFGTGPDQNMRLASLKGLNLIPFDIFVHYQPSDAEVIKQKIKNPKKRFKTLRILSDRQALLVQGKEIALIGDGDEIII